MRISVAAAVACLSITSLSAAEYAAAAMKRETQISAQNLGSALEEFARDRNLQLVYATDEVSSLRSSGAAGNLSADEALRQLLRGTGLSHQFLDEKTVTVQPARSAPPASPAGDAGTETSSQISDITIQEIIVTAQKRSERLQDVPVPVTAISAETLVSNNQTRLQDYYTNVPGFSMSQASMQGIQYLSLRGVSTGLGGPTVGVVIDDIPNGSSTAVGGGTSIPDLDPGELTRIEVLRGPQGTLYGANSMGGLLNYVTTDPSTAGVSGRVQLGTNSVRNGDGPGYNGRGSINVPLSDTWAVRASGFYRREAGYIDNDIRDREGVNEQTDSGGRLSALWRLSDAVSLKLGAIYQKTESEGANLIETLPTVRDFQQTYALDNPGDKTVKSYSAIVNAELGNDVTLTSLTGYNIFSFSGQGDVTAGYGGLFASFFPGAPTGVAQTNDYETKKLSQEVRVATSLGERFDWLIGGYYTKEDTEAFADLYAIDVPTRQVAGVVFLSKTPTTLKEYAVFSNLTYQVTERFDIQFGGRQSRFEQHATQRLDSVIFNNIFAQRPDPFEVFPEDSKLDAFTYLVTPRLKLTPDLMMYARLASGYRAGGVNLINATVPQEFDPDKTRNYEVGLKANFFDRRLSIDASVYSIDWQDIQLFLVDPVTRGGYFANGGKAKSEGVELAFESTPLRGLTVTGWVAWNEAELAEDLPASSPFVGRDGDRLPFNARTSGKLSVNQSFTLTDSLTGFLGAAVSYVGNRQSVFVTATGSRVTMPEYYRTDFTAGVQSDSWSANLYVNNVTDRRGVLMSGAGTSLPGGRTVLYIQPRVIGLTLTKSF